MTSVSLTALLHQRINALFKPLDLTFRSFKPFALVDLLPGSLSWGRGRLARLPSLFPRSKLKRTAVAAVEFARGTRALPGASRVHKCRVLDRCDKWQGKAHYLWASLSTRRRAPRAVPRMPDRHMFLLPGISALARCLPLGDELPVSRVTKNNPFQFSGHFVFLSF